MSHFIKPPAPYLRTTAVVAPANFQDDLAFSNSLDVQEFWTAIYRQLPGYSTHWVNENALDAQRRGVDVRVYTEQDLDIYIDEKSDRHRPNNFLLEYEHRYPSGRTEPGWMEKPLAVHFLAYGFVLHGVAYFLPWLSLQAAWRTHRAHWIAECIKSETPNKRGGYTSIGAAVPISQVFNAMGEPWRVDLQEVR